LLRTFGQVVFILFYFFVCFMCVGFVGQGKAIVFRFIIEYSSLRDFGPKVIIIIGLFLYEDF
jgi:hypothetical protein